MKTDYKRETIAAIKRAAGGDEPPSHILPRAYCVAKPRHAQAVFVVPHQDREPQVAENTSIVVCDDSASGCEVGKWYALAYVVERGCGGMRVVYPI
jgi:hypothetical protein